MLLNGFVGLRFYWFPCMFGAPASESLPTGVTLTKLKQPLTITEE